MKVAALLSGGKDSVLSLMMAYRFHHDPVVIANMAPEASLQQEGVHEVDSYMYQTVGHEVVSHIAACLGLPLRQATVGKNAAEDQSLHYNAAHSDGDEVEALYRLLKAIKEEFPDVKGVTSGAILSNYQRHRVEFVCQRLGLQSIAFLWHRDANEVLQIADDSSTTAILVKTASAGLDPKKLLGLTLQQARPTLDLMAHRYGGHAAGEGGEFETIVLDSPLFTTEKLEVESITPVMVDDNEYSPCGHAIVATRRVRKSDDEINAGQEYLRQLRSGEVVFPADRMPLLPSTEWEQQKPCGRAFSGTAFHPTITSVPLFTANQMSGNGLWDSHSTHCPLSTERATECLKATLSQCITDVLQSVHRKGNCAVYLLIDVPSPDHLLLAEEVYTTLAPAMEPPGATVLSSSAAAEKQKLEVVVLSVPAGWRRTAVHNQSLSCWAAGRPGPFTLAQRVAKAELDSGAGEPDALVGWSLVGGMAGIVPVTGELATAATDLPVALTASDSEQDLAAQFAFAYANAAQYASLMKKELPTADQILCIVATRSDGDAIPSLLQWCMCGTQSDCLPSLHVCVAELGGGKKIEMFALWREVQE